MNEKSRIKNEETGGRQGFEGQSREAEVLSREAADMFGALEDMASETEKSRRAAGGSVAETAVGWLGPRYLLALREQVADENVSGVKRLKLLRQAANDVVALQRGDIGSAKLQVERERLAFQRTKHQERLAAAKEGNQRRDPKQPMTEEELKACVDKVDEIFGLKRATRAVGALSMEGNIQR